MKLREFVQKRLRKSPKTGPNNEIVISSRVRVARNLASKPFPWHADDTSLKWVWEKVKDCVKKQKHFANSEIFYMPDLKTIDKQLLVERHIISYNHALGDTPRGVIFDANDQISIMVNEEDHIRLTAICPGFNLKESSEIVDSLDNKLGRELEFAFSEEWGYLTTCPTNAGTGLRASCLVHLPGLVMNDEIELLLEELSKLGVTVRGFYGEGTKIIGDIFQVANAVTLGYTETEILKNVEKVIIGIINYEKKAREDLMSSKMRVLIEDKIYRAKAILTNARQIDYQEATTMLSRVRLGVSLGLDIPWDKNLLSELMVITRPAHLQQIIGKELSSEEKNYVRSRIIRQKLS